MGPRDAEMADNVLNPFCFQKPFPAVCREWAMQCPSWEPFSTVVLGMQREPFSPEGPLLPALEQGAGAGPMAAVI